MDVVGSTRVDRVVENLLGGPCFNDVPGLPFAIDQEQCALCDTRFACCMLWVTITMVMSSLRSLIVLSMTLVDIGSSAEQGSSMSSTRGRTANERAMQRRWS